MVDAALGCFSAQGAVDLLEVVRVARSGSLGVVAERPVILRVHRAGAAVQNEQVRRDVGGRDVLALHDALSQRLLSSLQVLRSLQRIQRQVDRL